MFLANGFAVIDKLIDDDELASLRVAYEIISADVHARGDRYFGGVIRQVKDPSLDHPAFESNLALDAGVGLARSLFHGRAFAMATRC